MLESDAVDDLVRETIKLLGVECLCWRAEARVRAPGAREMSPQFYCRIGSRNRNQTDESIGMTKHE
jgi:hypothetical protein